jgi:hypothetical protein
VGRKKGGGEEEWHETRQKGYPGQEGSDDLYLYLNSKELLLGFKQVLT